MFSDVQPGPAKPPIRPDMTVRQVALDYRGCQEVFQRHGEPADRPSKFGHLEIVVRVNELLAARSHRDTLG